MDRVTLPLHSIDARKYRDRVVVQKPRSTDQIDQADDDNWVDYCPRWASVLPTGGREVMRGDQQVGLETHAVKMRFDEMTREITSRFRLKWEGRTLNIESPPVNVNDADQELQFSCREVTT